MAAEDALNLLSDLIAKAKQAGADAADAVLVDSTSLSVACRLGKPEKVERSEAADLGLRVLIGKRQALARVKGLPVTIVASGHGQALRGDIGKVVQTLLG